MDEILVLQEQLEELLEEEPEDADEALEVAMVAGLLTRLHPESHVLVRAASWRDGPGQELLEVAWDELEPEEHLSAIDDALAGELEGEGLEDALYDLDELAAASAWSGRPEAVRPESLRIAQEIEELSHLFGEIGPLGLEMARHPEVARDPDLYSFWLALADTAGVEGSA